jgi:hypothetical protein
MELLGLSKLQEFVTFCVLVVLALNHACADSRNTHCTKRNRKRNTVRRELSMLFLFRSETDNFEYGKSWS